MQYYIFTLLQNKTSKQMQHIYKIYNIYIYILKAITPHCIKKPTIPCSTYMTYM